jgi:hypothetical protein
MPDGSLCRLAQARDSIMIGQRKELHPATCGTGYQVCR